MPFPPGRRNAVTQDDVADQAATPTADAPATPKGFRRAAGLIGRGDDAAPLSAASPAPDPKPTAPPKPLRWWLQRAVTVPFVIAVLVVGWHLLPERVSPQQQAEQERREQIFGREAFGERTRVLDPCDYAPGAAPNFGRPANVQIADIPSYADRGCPEPE